jgi:hypothetical protein
MTTQNNQALRITELDFLSIKENLKNYLRNQSEFQDFDFEGSGMSVLLDILAYNTHYMSFYLNMVGNEMFLDTAQLRASVLSHAKMIGYVPSSSQGSEAKVNIRVTPSTNEPNTSIATLDRYTRFLAQDVDGVNYPFITLYSNTVSKSNGTFDFNNISIKQGEVVTLQYLMEPSNINRRFEIQSANVDISTLSISVQESTTNTYTTVYTRSTDITELSSTTPAYFIEENENLNYTFYFGDDVIGKKPKVGNVIICTYIDNIGSASNNISKFVFVDPVAGYNDNVVITTVSTSSGGVDKESIEQTRFRAPYFYTTQNRAVTKQDYNTLILKDFTNIESVSVWGGEENDPVVYGKIYISLKPKGNFVFTALEKENIKKQLQSRNIFTITPEIVDPNFSYLTLSGKVYYNPNKTSRTANEILSLVKATISDYTEQELNTFDSVFRKSKLQNFMENADPSITGSDIDVYMQKRLVLDTNVTKNYSVLFNTPLRKGDFDEKITSFPQINVRDTEGISRSVFFEEVPQAFTGVDSISIVNPGREYASVPTVTITGDGIGATAEAFIVNGRIDRIVVTNKGSNYTRATVSITGGGGSEASASAILQTNNGELRTYYFRSNGEKVIVNPNAGTIDYTNGRIDILSLLPLSVVENDFYDENVFTVSAPIDDQIIYPLRNRILTIDESDPSSIQIEVIAES